MQKLKPVTFPSQGSHPVELQGMLHLFDGEGQWPAAVVCHPHPLGGGAMHNAVVTAIARSLATRGIMALRFNFRGVGRSGGLYDQGRGEQADVAGAVDWLLAQPQVDPWRLYTVGYSFGAWVSLSHATNDPRVTAVAAVGLAAWHFDAGFSLASAGIGFGDEDGQFAAKFLHSLARPKLFIAAEHDTFAPVQSVRGLVDRIPAPKTLHVVAGTDHFFHGREAEVGELVTDFVTGL